LKKQNVRLFADPLEEATVDLVWDPAWEPGMMSAEAKQKLESGKAASSVPFFYSLNAQAHPQGIGERSAAYSLSGAAPGSAAFAIALSLSKR